MRQFRTATRDRGLRWVDVLSAYREIKAGEWDSRQRDNEVRAAAWMMATASRPACWPFWRHGFASRWGERIANGSDFTIIPGYDEIGQQIASEFPEYATDDGTERLFEFLLSPYRKMPPTETLFRLAMERVEYETRTRSATTTF